MWEPEDIAQAVNDHADIAADALAAVMLDLSGTMLTGPGLTATAQMLGRDPGEFWVEQLEARGAIDSFARALSIRGIPLDFGAAPLAASNIPIDALERFVRAARGFRCRIWRDGKVAGSGTLIGPTAVLTAWHVISAVGPDGPDGPPWPRIEVELADGRRMAARMPATFASPATLEEYASRLPANDDAIGDASDVAVVQLLRPAGALLGAAALPAAPSGYRARAAVVVVHYPDGQDVGLGIGAIGKIRGLTARWAHSVGSAAGSSGGGCFDASLTLAGVHQGKATRNRGRLVPIGRFHGRVRDIVSHDIAPPRMWSLDGTPQGDYVIGRQAFFEAFALARTGGRVRGIRVKRADAAGDLGGLAFSYRMLERMVARSPDTRVCRISFEALIADLPDDITRRAAAAGVDISAIGEAQGVADGQSAPEAVGADKGRRAATAINDRAAALGVELWFFIDHPAIAFGDAMRAALEGFIDQALRLPRLRLVIVGFEAVALPGQEFQGAPATETGVPGLMTDIIAGFGESDVRLFLADAAAAAGVTLSVERVDELVDLGLEGLANINGLHEPWLAGTVVKRLRPYVEALFA